MSLFIIHNYIAGPGVGPSFCTNFFSLPLLCTNFFSWHFPLHEFFFGFFPSPPITFLMVRPLEIALLRFIYRTIAIYILHFLRFMYHVCDLQFALLWCIIMLHLRFINRTITSEIYKSHFCDLYIWHLRFVNRTFVIYISHLRFVNRILWFIYLICDL